MDATTDHQCEPPGYAGAKWKCPDCNQVWVWSKDEDPERYVPGTMAG
jgi:hypothetical protein